MKDFFSNKNRYYENFAYAVYRYHKKLRYGVSSCKPEIDLDLAMIRKELVDWQSNNDGEALCQTNMSFTTWLPVDYRDDELARPKDLDRTGPGYVHSYSVSGPQTLGMGYTYGNGTQNIIEVNTGGCVTRINLNPAITVNNGAAFQYSQGTASDTWVIHHNLGYVPNVWEKDLLGNNIDGTVEVVDLNNIIIHFSSAVAGVAYLS